MAARKLADHIVDLAPVSGCFTADIQKAIQDGQTPVSVPDTVMAPQPDHDNLDRFLNSSAPVRPLVTVNGCFDVLHLGHMRLLAQARNLGARLLVSPQFHRLHHSMGAGHESAGQGSLGGHNFAVLFPVWDVLFGTAHFGAAVLPTGIRDQLPEAGGRDYGQGFWQQQWRGLLRLAGRT